MDLFDEQAARVLGLGRSDLRALNLLEHGPLSAASLADRLGLTRTAITALVDRLVSAGYATRNPDPSDRRSISIQLEAATGRLSPRSTARSANAYRLRLSTSPSPTATSSSQLSAT